MKHADLNDGPYVTRAGGDLEVSWICSGKLVFTRVAIHGDTTKIAPLCGYRHTINVTGPSEPETGFATSPKARVIAISDVHGQFDLLVRLLRMHGLVDRSLQWTAGSDVLVVDGDLLDRGGQVTEIFWLLYSLQQQAKESGGAVHVLLGNHEAIELSGYLKYLNPKYRRAEELTGHSYPELYGADTVIGQWLRTRPVMLKIGDLLFVHGGVAPENERMALEILETNTAYQGAIGLPRHQTRSDPKLAPLFDTYRSPIWYRGYMNGELSTDQVAEQLARLGVSRVIVGHTTLPHISSFHRNLVIGIDAGLKGGVTGELLIIQRDGTLNRGLLDGSLKPVVLADSPVPASTD